MPAYRVYIINVHTIQFMFQIQASSIVYHYVTRLKKPGNKIKLFDMDASC